MLTIFTYRIVLILFLISLVWRIFNIMWFVFSRLCKQMPKLCLANEQTIKFSWLRRKCKKKIFQSVNNSDENSEPKKLRISENTQFQISSKLHSRTGLLLSLYLSFTKCNTFPKIGFIPMLNYLQSILVYLCFLQCKMVKCTFLPNYFLVFFMEIYARKHIKRVISFCSLSTAIFLLEVEYLNVPNRFTVWTRYKNW